MGMENNWLMEKISNELWNFNGDWMSASKDRQKEILMRMIERLKKEAPLLFAQGIADEFIEEHPDVIRGMAMAEIYRAD